VAGLEFEQGILRFSSDYVSGRLMKTDISFEPGDKGYAFDQESGEGCRNLAGFITGKEAYQASEVNILG